MERNMINRLTEALAILCVVAAAVILVRTAGVSPVDRPLAALSVQEVAAPDVARFQLLLDEARRQVDTNRDPTEILTRLKGDFPGRHEVWALSARDEESKGLQAKALASYARAVKLQPDYMDERSDLFLGKRIEALTGSVMERLQSVRKERELDPGEKTLLKTAYFLKRRIAGGCE